MQTTVVESSMIKVPESTPMPIQTIKLSLIEDLFPKPMYSKCIYVYRFPTASAAGCFDTKLLISSLKRVLASFYPVAGRLRLTGHNCVEINCNNAGVVFVEARATGTLKDMGDFIPNPSVHLVPAITSGGDLSTMPLVMLQVTRFRCGGVCLGVVYEHHLSDGPGTVHFINEWANVTRGRDIRCHPVFVQDRQEILSARNPPQPICSHVEFQPPPSITSSTATSSENVVTSCLPLSKAQLRALKAKCVATSPGVSYTSYEALAGHAWRCTCLVRKLPPDQLTKLRMVVDGRRRLQPPIPQQYFMNLLFHATPVVRVGELVTNPIGYSARKVHESIAEMKSERLVSALDYLGSQRDLRSVARNVFAYYSSPNASVISWANQPIREADFGWGKPVHGGPWLFPGEHAPTGAGLVLDNLMEEGGLIYLLALPSNQMELFVKFFYDI